MGSSSDQDYCKKIGTYCNLFGLNYEIKRVSSANKGTKETLKIVSEYEGVNNNLVFNSCCWT